MQRIFAFLAACAVSVSLGATPGVAQDGTPLRQLSTADDNRGWEAVGRLNMGDRAYCTAALISEDLVLTAAHCLFDRETGVRFEDNQIEFLAGWRSGRAVAYRDVRRSVVHPDFTFEGTNRVTRVAHDLALLRLSRPIRNARMTPFEIDERPSKGDQVGVVSYARERSEAPSLQESCHVLARQGGVLVLSCEADHGASGSPIFVIRDGVPRIVSVVTAMAEIRERRVSLGTSLDRPLTLLREMMDEAPAEALVTRNAAPTVRVFGTTRSGAKFVKPGE